MSSDELMMRFCASCGTAEVDEIKLKTCDDCDLVRYCSVKCQQEHQSQHGEMCKERAAELRDEILFRQPEGTHRGDCPICFLPLSLNMKESSWYSCCCTLICDGCGFANQKRESEKQLEQACPFCRHPLPKSAEEADLNYEKRFQANDPVIIQEMGSEHFAKEDYDTAFRYWTNAAELGDVEAHYNLSLLYYKGQGVEKDEKKVWHHLEEAAIGGDTFARHNLGVMEGENGRPGRAVKHFIIAAKLGDDDSLEALKEHYADGFVSKEDFAAALRGHQAAVDATKSPHREEAEIASSQQSEGGSRSSSKGSVK